MPFPSGLKFKHRVAEDSAGFYFDCGRSTEHPKDKPRFRATFDSKDDRDTYITRHDAIYHDYLLAQQIGADRGDEPSLGEIAARFLRRLDERVRNGEADQRTLDYYRQNSKRLLHHLGVTTPASKVTTQRIMLYDDLRRKETNEKGGETRGALIKKEIASLGTMYRDFGIAPAWVLKRGSIRAKKRPKVPIGVDKVIRFILAMDLRSLERDFTMLKFATGMRNEELYAANVKDVDLEARELEYELKNKQGEIERHVTYLNDFALEILTRRVDRRTPNAPLFVIEGRRLTYSSLRKRFIAASKRATETWLESDPHAPVIKIEAVGQFRHEAATEVLDRLKDIRVAQGQLGHKSETTTERYMLEDRKKKVANSKRFTEATDKAMEPLRTRKTSRNVPSTSPKPRK